MKKIVILEDNKPRRDVMRDCVRDRFHQFELVFFDDAAEMRTYLETNLRDTLIISLDHDLEMKPQENGELKDPGTGREVADFLAAQTPSCPIIIASTNTTAADSMDYLLRDAHWETHRVYPWGDLEWISTQWFKTLRNAIVSTAKPRDKNKV